MSNSEQALAELGALQEQFEQAAATERKPRFFQSWFEDGMKEELYDSLADDVAKAKSLLGEQKPDEASAVLVQLKTEFTETAANWRRDGQSFFADWFADYAQNAEEFDGYAKKVDSVLKLI